MIPRQISRATLESQPYEAWNAFINILAMEKTDDLDSVQRVPHLCFWYDSEVQNGGHLQYFENQGTKNFQATLASLNALGADCQATVLKEAGDLFLSKPRTPIASVEEYMETALEAEYDKFDRAYHVCEPTIQKLLEIYLEHNKNHFIEIV